MSITQKRYLYQEYLNSAMKDRAPWSSTESKKKSSSPPFGLAERISLQFCLNLKRGPSANQWPIKLALIITTLLIGPQLNTLLEGLLVLNENHDSSGGLSKSSQYCSIMGCILSTYRICYWTYNHYI